MAASFSSLERIGRIRLSDHFFMRDFLYSETAVAHGLVNVPDDEKLAVAAGSMLCRELLEPLQAKFGRLHIRSAFRSAAVNEIGNMNGRNCARNEANSADHIWDKRDAEGNVGATACVVIPAFADAFPNQGDWTELAWWIHDHLPYSTLFFFKDRWAANIQWRENPERRIDSFAEWFDGSDWTTKRCLTRSGMTNHAGNHNQAYARLEAKFS